MGIMGNLDYFVHGPQTYFIDRAYERPDQASSTVLSNKNITSMPDAAITMHIICNFFSQIPAYPVLVLNQENEWKMTRVID